MLNAKEQESSGAELSDDAKARTHRAVEQYTDSALAKGRQMGVQQRAALQSCRLESDELANRSRPLLTYLPSLFCQLRLCKDEIAASHSRTDSVSD